MFKVLTSISNQVKRLSPGWNAVFIGLVACDIQCTLFHVPADVENCNDWYLLVRLGTILLAFINDYFKLNNHRPVFFIHMFSTMVYLYSFCFTLFGPTYHELLVWYPIAYGFCCQIVQGFIIHQFIYPHPELEEIDESKLTESELKERKEEQNLKKNLSKVKLAWKLLTKMLPAMKQFMCVWLFVPFAAFCDNYFEVVIGQIFDLIRANDDDIDRPAIYRYMLCLFLIGGCFKPFFNWLRDYFQMNGCVATVYSSRSFTLTSILKQDFGFFDIKSSGALNTILTGDIDSMAHRLFWNFRWLVEITVRIGMILYFCFSMNVRLATLTTSFLPFILSTGIFFTNLMYNIDDIHSDLSKECNRVGLQALQNIRTVRAFHCEEREYNEYMEKLGRVQSKERERTILHSNFWAIFVLFPEASRAIVLYWGLHLIEEGNMSGGELVTFMLLQNRFCHLCGHLARVWRSVMEGLAKGSKVFRMLERQPSFTSTKKETIKDLDGYIEFKGVEFRYPKYPEIVVFKNLDLLIEPGQVVALIGPSGQGKSTILQLIQFFYKQQAGTITLDNVPLEHLDPGFLRTRVVAVEQDPTLFDRSIRDNICYGLDNVSDEDVTWACEMANCTEFIEKLPDKYQTVVGERGVTLSGGQKQRICIARALVRKPKILLLDEATSSLDSESEAVVHAAIEKLMQHYTVVVVAHRLSTIKNADKICVVQDNHITETGSHKALLAKRGKYYDLINKQVHTESECKDDVRLFEDTKKYKTTKDDLALSKEDMEVLKQELANYATTEESGDEDAEMKNLTVPTMKPASSSDIAA